MLDTKKGYLEVRRRYSKMDTEALQKTLAKLHKMRYEEHNLDSVEHHRIASAVYNRRVRSGTGLIFHMQEFLR
jgi:hypothetical protein